MPGNGLLPLTFVLGGARSGKSAYAEDLLKSLPPPWIYIATAQIFDDEMRHRVDEHQSRRADSWHTLEEPMKLTEAVRQAAQSGRPMLIDCLTLWLSNVMLAERDVYDEIEALVVCLRTVAADDDVAPIVVVSNEVGLGIVPDNALARAFRDAQGRLNARVAALSDHAVLMSAGLPLKPEVEATPDAVHQRTQKMADDKKTEDRHQAKMANRKAIQDAEVASKTIEEKGLLIVHTGKGKGKSTAAWGLMLRALGRGFKIGVCSSPRERGKPARRRLLTNSMIQIVWHTLGEGFTWETQDRDRDVAAAEKAWAKEHKS